MDGTSGQRNNGTSGTAAAKTPTPGCKALLVDEASFAWLKHFQASHPPRLELRYLLEGLIEWARQTPQSHELLVRHARGCLKRHLDSLDQPTP